MTAADLLTDERFLWACREWEAAGRCPIQLADYLRELGLEGQAAGAEWAALEPDRHGGREFFDGPEWGGIRPDGWRAWHPERSDFGPKRSVIPDEVYNALTGFTYELPHTRGYDVGFAFHPEAIAAFLDAWATARTEAS